MKIALIVDGASSGNGGSCGAGVVAKNFDSGETLQTASRPYGEGTNNFAEYKAVELALEVLDGLLKQPVVIDSVVILTDSNLVVSQLQGKFKVKNKTLKPLVAEMRNKINEYLVSIEFDHVPREYTHEADELAREVAVKAKETDVEKKYPFLTRKET